MNEREALKMALEALKLNEKCSQSMDIQICADASQKTFHAITAIKEALAQPPEEPVAWYDTQEYGSIRWANEWSLDEGTPLYTTPPQRTWVGLTDEVVKDIQTNMVYRNQPFRKVIEAIEARLKQKNGYAEEKNT